MLKQPSNRPPSHPGTILREDVLPALGISKAEVARSLGISRHSLHAILNEKKPITPHMAVRFGKLCGNGARVWLNMQSAHDLWLAERAINVENIPTLIVSDIK